RLLAIESVTLALLAAGAAIATAGVTGSVLRALLLPDTPFADSALHWRVGLFTAAVAAIAGLAVGVFPTLQAMRPQLVSALHGGQRDGAPRSLVRAGLVVAQVALSAMLLVGAAAFVRSLWNVESIRLGF